ncbi:MAG TPA: hypothetical protein VKV04_23920 [Verrucomicrobiae bacterium]|nr:hypothetical protein [Verrucomicrobiae bacterium]
MNSDKPSPPFFQLFPGLWIVMGIVVLLGARVAWGWMRFPHGIEKLARELSSIYVIQKYPMVNHAETSLAMIRTTEHGEGVFIENLADKSEQKICEVADVDYKASGAWVFGWSMDDKTLAYSWDRTLRFVANDGTEPGGNVDGITNHFQSFTWLTPERCAYIDDYPRLVYIEHKEGKWKVSQRWDLWTTNGMPHSIQAMGPNVVAWQTTNTIWQMDFSSGVSKVLYSNSRRQIDSICFSTDTGTFLTVESTNHGRTCFLVSIIPGEGGAAVTALLRKPSILNAQWINRGQGYVYGSQVRDKVVLTSKSSVYGQEQPVFQATQMTNFFANGSNTRIYLLGAQASEPAGVWRCNADSAEVQCVLSPSAGMSFHYQPVLQESATYAENHTAAYELLQPAGFSRHKKYPLVIGLGSYEWTPIAHGIYAQCLANSGAYVAFVHYRWNQSHPETVYAHTNNFMAVYDQLAVNPNIDTQRVFIFGFSAGTKVLSELTEQFPGRWRGIMLLNPSPLPEPEERLARRVLATAGSDEGDENRFGMFQEQLAKIGIPMQWHIHQNAQHVVRDEAAMYERTLWMADMVFEK